MKKNAKLAPLQTSLRQVAAFLHNADFLRLRVTKPPPDSPTERCCFALLIGCGRKCVKHFKNNLPGCATCIKVIVLTMYNGHVEIFVNNVFKRIAVDFLV